MQARGAAFLRTTAFRQTLLSAALFALSSFVTLGFVYAASAGMVLRRADSAINEEVEALDASFQAGGIRTVNRYILERTVGGGADYLYLLVHPTGRSLSGNLTYLPDVQPDDEGRVQFTYRRPAAGDRDDADGKDDRTARGRIIDLPSGYRLYVGLDVDEETRLVSRMLNTILAASALALALGVAAGIFVSRRFVRRLDRINTVARRVKAGDLQPRAPRNFTGDELDELSENFNNMLDRVEALMHRMRHTGDSIAHDLRTPLTRMRNRLDEALREDGDRASREQALERAVADTDELLGIFNAILSLSRLEAGESRASIGRLDPADIAADLAELYEPVCEDEGLAFASEIQSGLTMLGDRGLLSQALANILDNAVKYTPSGGAVTLRLRETGEGKIEFSVTDTGPGIPDTDRERVTQRFVRLDNSRTKPGSGLGLSLVQAIVDVHNGQFELTEGPGVVEGGHGPGLRASLCFPKAPAKPD
ncbi:sensor histidine kinase [Maricaulis maris]|jgi:signal transduction histidine kinase|uniref:sensor histidine kinase n=1 Tax=Maricaulis maris TaxID=74318 RepID=UPI00291F3846|nr:two-component sensor histidine kinase [Maricaulis maris]